MITERDDALLASVFQHRFLAARHAHWLHFSGSGLRAVQRRLRRLWEHGYLDRAFIPTVVIGDGSGVPHTGGPLYCLAAAGARRVATATGRSLREIPSTPGQNRVSFETLCHHLVVTDWLTSIAAHRGRALVPAEVVREGTLRPLATRDRRLLVPDGAARFRAPHDAWCYLEVVRADPRGGRRTLLTKMRRYVELHHRRTFRTGYGHHPLRRVLFVAPSSARCEGLLALTASLDRGAQLFAFASYGARPSMSAPSAFTPETVDAAIWRTAGTEHPRSLSALLSTSHATS